MIVLRGLGPNSIWVTSITRWLIPPLLVVLSFSGWTSQQRRLPEIQNSIAHATLRHQALLQVQPQPASAARPGTNFALKLPNTRASWPQFNSIRRVTEAHGVELQSLNATEQVSAGASLGRLQTEIVMKGTFEKIKSVLAEILNKEAGQVVLQSLSLRRLTIASADVEARAMLVWPLRPKQADMAAEGHAS